MVENVAIDEKSIIADYNHDIEHINIGAVDGELQGGKNTY